MPREEVVQLYRVNSVNVCVGWPNVSRAPDEARQQVSPLGVRRSRVASHPDRHGSTPLVRADEGKAGTQSRKGGNGATPGDHRLSGAFPAACLLVRRQATTERIVPTVRIYCLAVRRPCSHETHPSGRIGRCGTMTSRLHGPWLRWHEWEHGHVNPIGDQEGMA